MVGRDSHRDPIQVYLGRIYEKMQFIPGGQLDIGETLRVKNPPSLLVTKNNLINHV